jgi:hypothetical protein
MEYETIKAAELQYKHKSELYKQRLRELNIHPSFRNNIIRNKKEKEEKKKIDRIISNESLPDEW